MAGGTGKTPLARWLAEFLHSENQKPAILIRGYGKRGGNEVLCLGDGREKPVSWMCVGDEPYMLANQLPGVPILVGKGRYRSATIACREHDVRTLILDDGFQYLNLERDIDLVLLDCARPFDDGNLLPLGKLREPVSHLARASAFVLTRASNARERERSTDLLKQIFPSIPVFACSHYPVDVLELGEKTVHDIGWIESRRLLAFAGIGQPESFFEMLRALRGDLAETIAFPDHYPYKRKEMEKMVILAKRCHVNGIITTEKDAVRIPQDISPSIPLFVLRIDVTFWNESRFCTWLKTSMKLK